MITAYRASTSSIARSALSIALRLSRPKSTHNPLKPPVETDELGLPVTPAELVRTRGGSIICVMGARGGTTRYFICFEGGGDVTPELLDGPGEETCSRVASAFGSGWSAGLAAGAFAVGEPSGSAAWG